MEYNFSKIEKKWQKRWEEKKAFQAKEDRKKKKYYVLEMYPYPSASFLHMGHVRNYTIGDVYARFKRMSGFNVLYPMGYDSFGLPAETAAKKQNIHPKKYTEDSIKKIMNYQKALGNSYDWDRTLASHEPDYYKWNQYFFLKLFEKGLAYRKKAPVNWCENCQSVLANEEAEGGKCWRCGNEVVKKQMEQWFYRITAYADKLIDGLQKIKWPDRIKAMQKNWIGKSYGSEILFEINGEKWPIFTTRPDTIYGVTFMVVSSQHPRLMELVSPKQKKDVEKFLSKNKTTKQEEIEKLEKEGVFTGSYAINPITKENIPVYAGNFVIADYGSGMVMAVPSHDQRDFDFAKKYKIKIKPVVQYKGEDARKIIKNKAYEGTGVLIDSGEFSGLDVQSAKNKITEYLIKKKLGRFAFNYKLRDWMISRQRYWGTPIPIIYCEKCGIVPVPEKELPVLLPEKVDFTISGNPLLSNKQFLNVKCPKCRGKGTRETDTMGGFVDSSWYFLRYCDSKNKRKAFEKEKVDYWMPVDQYIGGAEHAVMHLMYARFFVKALKDLKFIDFDEPFMKLFNQGVVYNKNGKRMSKSSGQVVFQTDISNKYGIDTARLFLMSVSSPDKDMLWNDEGVEGSFRFLNRLIKCMEKTNKIKIDEKTSSKMNIAIKTATENIENFNYPKAVISSSEFLDYLSEMKEVPSKAFEELLKLVSPFCPHIAEELWEKLGNKGFISLEKWPEFDKSRVNDKFEEQEKQIEGIAEDIRNIIKIFREKSRKEPGKAYIYVIPKEFDLYEKETENLKKKTELEIKVFSVSDKNKHDPENKAGKAKPGKPALYLE